MLKITELSNLALKAPRAKNNKIVRNNNNKVDEMVRILSKSKKLKHNKFKKITYIEVIKELIFLTLNI